MVHHHGLAKKGQVRGKILSKGVKIHSKGLGKSNPFVMWLINKIMLHVVNKECIEVKKKDLENNMLDFLLS